ACCSGTISGVAGNAPSPSAVALAVATWVPPVPGAPVLRASVTAALAAQSVPVTLMVRSASGAPESTLVLSGLIAGPAVPSVTLMGVLSLVAAPTVVTMWYGPAAWSAGTMSAISANAPWASTVTGADTTSVPPEPGAPELRATVPVPLAGQPVPSTVMVRSGSVPVESTTSLSGIVVGAPVPPVTVMAVLSALTVPLVPVRW